MSAGKQPQDPGPSTEVLTKNKESSTLCPICTNDLLHDGVVMLDCGHWFCGNCHKKMKEISLTKGVSRPPCPVCRKNWPDIIPGHAVVNLLEVVVQQDVTLAAVRDEAAAELAAVRAKAAAELAAVRAEAAGASSAAADELDKVKARHALEASAKVETERMRLAGKNEVKERNVRRKAAADSAQDELEKQMMKEDRERDAPMKAKKEKREEDQDKDWNPNSRK